MENKQQANKETALQSMTFSTLTELRVPCWFSACAEQPYNIASVSDTL